MMPRKHTSKVYNVSGRDVRLVGSAIKLFEFLQTGPKSMSSIQENLGLAYSTTVLSLKKMQAQKIVFESVKKKTNPIRTIKVWAVGEKPNDDTVPSVEFTLCERKREQNELSARKSIAEEYIKMHLRRQQTPFGWLAENAGAAPLPKLRGTQCKH